VKARLEALEELGAKYANRIPAKQNLERDIAERNFRQGDSLPLCVPPTKVFEHPLSLIAAAALWSGLATDTNVLHQPTVVIRPNEPFAGHVQAGADATLQVRVWLA
jgi:hypothetical protein